MAAATAFFRFHLRVGARLAMRVLAPALASVLFLFYVLRPEFMLALARGLFVDGGLVESGLAGGLILLALARTVAPRIAAGRGGWARSLPAGGRLLRALETLSTVVAQSPLLAVLMGLAWAVARPNKGLIALRIAGLVVGAAAAGLLFLRRPASLAEKALPATACFLSLAGDVVVLSVAAAILVLALALPEASKGGGGRRRERRGLSPAFFFPGLSLRAGGARLALAYVPPAVVLGASRLFLANNELSAAAASSLSLFGLVLGFSFLVGAVCNILAARRPAWPWLRSLPRSSAARVGSDAAFLGLLALPLAAGLAFLGRPAQEAANLAGPLAWLALRGAAAIREALDRPFGPLGQVLVEGAILAFGVAVWPWLAWFVLVASPVAFLLARGAERRLKPTLWAERHHLDAGDPLSWSPS
jgi:hypothetical protein